MGKQMTFAEARARCHALGITPGRSLVECEHRIRERENYETAPAGAPTPLAPSHRGVPIVEVREVGKHPALAAPYGRLRYQDALTEIVQRKAHMRRVRRVETIMGSLTGLLTVVRIMAPVGRGGW